MSLHDRSTPEGTRDLLFEECAARQHIQETLRSLFTSAGYDEVKTPTLEFYDVFSHGAGIFPQENMFKLTDNNGRLIVMRPDNTTPIARLVAMRLKEAKIPLRLYYNQTVYRPTRLLSGRSLEIQQMGVELIGSSSYRADLQVLELAVHCLSSQGQGVRLEICHIGFFKAIMDALYADEDTRERLRILVEQKNLTALSAACSALSDTQASRALQMLPQLYGGEEVLTCAASLFASTDAVAALETLRELYRDLAAMGLSDRITIDLGVVHQAEYYTGVVFRGYMDSVGEAVLLGGRYDRLIEAFGRPLCAVGFGVNTDLLAEQLLAKTGAEVQPQRILIHPEENCYVKGYAHMRKLIGEGFLCEMSTFDTLTESTEYAKKAGIEEMHVVSAHGLIEKRC